MDERTVTKAEFLAWYDSQTREIQVLSAALIGSLIHEGHNIAVAAVCVMRLVDESRAGMTAPTFLDKFGGKIH